MEHQPPHDPRYGRQGADPVDGQGGEQPALLERDVAHLRTPKAFLLPLREKVAAKRTDEGLSEPR